MAQQRRGPVLEPLDVPATVDGQQLEDVLVDQGVVDVGCGVRIHVGTKLPECDDDVDEAALVDVPSPPCLLEQTSDVRVGGGAAG